MTPLEETTRQQTLAADPARSAFVVANAGSGKTRVLTNRVARLLAAGVDPQKILCITFTKAASVEMTTRLFSLLGEWAFFDDEELQSAFRKLEGDEYRKRSVEELAKIRVLFARALETPGGLKIQTIHSFCEYILKRFPLEAGVPPGFSVLEDSETSVLLDASIDRLAVDGSYEVQKSLRRLSSLMFESDLRALLRSSVLSSLRDAKYDDDVTTAQLFKDRLSKSLGVDPGASEHALKTEIIDSILPTEMERAQDALHNTGGNPGKLVPFTTAFLFSDGIEEKWNALASLLLVKNGAEIRKQVTTKTTDKIDPWAAKYLSALQERFWTVAKKVRALRIANDTLALETLKRTLQEFYTFEKSCRACLDFDDLIRSTLNLFSGVDNAWVMYKLDNGIDHVLIDEAQDTSPQQWEIVERLLADYLAGVGARQDRRSFFAVGDLKQSIYAFQGADAKLFEAKAALLGKKLGLVGEYLRATLAMSFRSSRPILDFVDKLFEPAEAAAGLGDGAIPTHISNRENDAGLVEIWPLVPRPDAQEVNPWDAPLDLPGDEHPARILSRHVAKEISSWIGHEDLPSQGRTIEPGDILILVQTRGALFNEVIRELSNERVAVAGADRLKLLEDPAIEDMISFAKFVTFNGDDLSLAETLKSPLFGFTDDDLFEIAHNRGAGVSLWKAFSQKSAGNPCWKQAFDEISAAAVIGLREGPFAFFSYILEQGEISGRKRFFRRLTESAKDSLDELMRQALRFEQGKPRSLKLFIGWFERSAGEIKREMENANDAVRVMTVHGAKGLEAPIVILLDAHRRPASGKNGPLFDVGGARKYRSAKTNALVARSEFHTDQTAAARDAAKMAMFEEYRRLLYVAATRARDRLYICGIELGNDKNPREKAVAERSWHSLALDAFEAFKYKFELVPAPVWAKEGEKTFRYSSTQEKPPDKITPQSLPVSLNIPEWLDQPVAYESQRRHVTPSRLADEFEGADSTAEEAALSPLDGDIYYRGRVIHRLLELLPDLPPNNRSQAAKNILHKIAPELDEIRQKEWTREVIDILSNNEFSAVFAENSRAEVTMAGTPKGTDIFINGQVDRLAVTEKTVFAVDYKTNRPPPDRIEDAPTAYVAQMAAYRALLQEMYPDHEISLALLWTFAPRLMLIPDKMLDHAFACFLATG